MRKEILLSELNERIKRNENRLREPYYQIDQVFVDQPDWPGDKEGRALLAFVSHYKISGEKIPCMDQLMDRIPEKTGNTMYFGPETGEIILEQQLSGCSWYLRGLCEYYEQFGDERALNMVNETVAHIYLPLRGRIRTYPLKREDRGGAVSGNSVEILNGWNLSTDVGCAFMSIDGLSHAYQVTKNPELLELLEEMCNFFDAIDKVALKAQTHCTLTAARGFLRLYETTKEPEYLKKARKIQELYVKNGMTGTCANYNWFGKGDTWTEPCAIVDSLMLSGMLYKITGEESFRTCAVRIYHNALASAQRPNGGAGTDTTVGKATPVLHPKMYEAPFCCTMRLAEGLWYIHENREMLYAQQTGFLEKDKMGRYWDGDLLYGEIPEHLRVYADQPKQADGRTLYPLLNYYRLPDEETCMQVTQRIIF